MQKLSRVERDRESDLERGMRIIPELPEIMPEEADERVAAVYEDVHATLRVPFVNYLFRVLANYPDYLANAWGEVAPFLLERSTEAAADDLRARALLEDAVPPPPRGGWARFGNLRRIRALTDTIHYVLPKLLLVATAFDEGLGGAPVGGRDSRGPALPGPGGERIPRGVAGGTAKASMVHPEDASGRLADVLQVIREQHGHPGIASYYRALANWPGFLEEAWGRIETIVGSRAYEARKADLLARASDAVQGLPLPGLDGTEALAEANLTDEDLVEVRSILAVFRFRMIPDLLLDVSLIKAMVDGPEAAHVSRFSALR